MPKSNKKPATPKVYKVTETYSFEHKGIVVGVRINYRENRISLVDQNGHDKNWLFANRGVEFMGGWLNILEAMQLAVKDAKAKYEAELANGSELTRDHYGFSEQIKPFEFKLPKIK